MGGKQCAINNRTIRFHFDTVSQDETQGVKGSAGRIDAHRSITAADKEIIVTIEVSDNTLDSSGHCILHDTFKLDLAGEHAAVALECSLDLDK